MATSMLQCPAECGWAGASLEGHYRWSPFCRPAPIVEPEAVSAKRKRDPSRSAQLFASRVAGTVSKAMLRMHVDHYMNLKDLDLVRDVVIVCSDMLAEFVESELQQCGSGKCGDLDLFQNARRAFTSLPNAATMVEQRRRVYQRAFPRSLSTGTDKGAAKDKKGAAIFSAHNLVTILLQESTAVRKLAIAASKKWKTGELYGTRPTVISDVTHGTRFLDWFAVCGKATAAEAKDLRILLHGWTDEFTPLDGLSQKARKHKYGAVTCAIVNLPLRMRHYADHVLLLALYNSQYAKANGGLVRILTGVGFDGKVHNDGCTLAGELALGDASPEISLPDDDNPAGDPVTWRLRLFVSLMSFDWLAAGEFGPFAGSVSARRPCGKCFWFAGCPCSFLPRSDPRRQTMTHHLQCRGVEPRTHSSVMETVAELRALAAQPRTKSAMANMSTDTGIFSTHFASEHILRDVVRDSTIDVMHVNYCGLTRYLLSWMTDEYIPRDFSWAQLNAEKKRYAFKRGVRVPDLERTKGDTRGSCSIHLTGAEAMAFAIARSASNPPPCPCCLAKPRPQPRSGSPIIMAPLIVNKEDHVWKCWLKHVDICRFTSRHSFVRGVDGARIDKLNDDFLEELDKVTQWKGYEKPKLHPGSHYAETLDELGPFRAVWCFPWEAYLQVLKHMFNICNWKSAPYTVAVHWATKSVMHYRDPKRGSWYTDFVEASAEWAHHSKQDSELLAKLVEMNEVPHVVRPLRSVKRGPDDVRLGDWVAVRKPGATVARVGFVEQMLQCRMAGAPFSYIRVWCSKCKELHEDPVTGILYSNSGESSQGMVVKFENMQVEVVVRSVCEARDEFL